MLSRAWAPSRTSHAATAAFPSGPPATAQKTGTPVPRSGTSRSRPRQAGQTTPSSVRPAGCGTGLTCRSDTGPASPAIGRFVIEELIEVATVSHLPQPGQGAQPHKPLPHLAKGSVHGVLLGRGPKDLSGYGQCLLVDLDGCFRCGHAMHTILPVRHRSGYHGCPIWTSR